MIKTPVSNRHFMYAVGALHCLAVAMMWVVSVGMFISSYGGYSHAGGPDGRGDFNMPNPLTIPSILLNVSHLHPLTIFCLLGWISLHSWPLMIAKTLTEAKWAPRVFVLSAMATTIGFIETALSEWAILSKDQFGSEFGSAYQMDDTMGALSYLGIGLAMSVAFYRAAHSRSALSQPSATLPQGTSDLRMNAVDALHWLVHIIRILPVKLARLSIGLERCWWTFAWAYVVGNLLFRPFIVFGHLSTSVTLLLATQNGGYLNQALDFKLRLCWACWAFSVVAFSALRDYLSQDAKKKTGGKVTLLLLIPLVFVWLLLNALTLLPRGFMF